MSEPSDLARVMRKLEARLRFEVLRNDLAKYGRKVKCEVCGTPDRYWPRKGLRLRDLACTECGGRLRPNSWRERTPPRG